MSVKMESRNFTLKEIDLMQTNYSLPIATKNIILSLDKLFYSTNTTIRPENKKDFTNINIKDTNRRKKKNVEDTSNIPWETESDWNKGNKSNTSYKKTSIQLTPIGFEKEKDNIRIALNKISDKNYNSQKEIIFTHLIVFETDATEMEKIGKFILETVSSNKFYSELYADLYKGFIVKYSVFADILTIMVSEFKNTIDTIRMIDANVDYDGFCECIKENDKRRSISSFIMLLCNEKVIAKKMVVNIIYHFQFTFLEMIDKKEKIPIAEEIAELLFILISMGHKQKLFIKKRCWIEYIVPNIFLTSKMKNNEHPSLSSRAIFKHLDLVDILEK